MSYVIMVKLELFNSFIYLGLQPFGQINAFGCCLVFSTSMVWFRWKPYSKGICLRWGYYTFTERVVYDKEWEGSYFRKYVSHPYIFHIKCIKLRLFWLERLYGV